MGSTHTYNVIGVGEEREDRSSLYPAMSHLDMQQQAEKAKRRGDKIVDWYWQTQTGRKMLERRVKVKTVVCPTCKGSGCRICNFSGITTKRWLAGFQDWQLKPTESEAAA